MSEAEIGKVKAQLARLGELGRLVTAKLGWLYDQRNMAEILEKAKKAAPKFENYIELWKGKPHSREMYEALTIDWKIWFNEYFGEPQK